MHIATWLVAVPWRNSFIGAFSGEFQNLRSDASSGKRTSAVRAPTGLPSFDLLSETKKMLTEFQCSTIFRWRTRRNEVTLSDDVLNCRPEVGKRRSYALYKLGKSFPSWCLETVSFISSP